MTTKILTSRHVVQDYAKMPRNPWLSEKSRRPSILKPLFLVAINLGLIVTVGYLIHKFI